MFIQQILYKNLFATLIITFMGFSFSRQLFARTNDLSPCATSYSLQAENQALISKRTFMPSVPHVPLPCDTDLAQPLPPEISAMLMDPQFPKTMDSLKKTAFSQGKILRIGAYELLPIGEKTFAYLYLNYKFNNEVNGVWQPYGSLTSQIIYTTDQNVKIDGLWFTPVAEPPGGATVGN